MLVCLVAAFGGLLFGYDTAVISGAIGFLQERFALSPAQTGWAASCALLGCIAGVAIAGTMNDRFGRKKVLVLAAVMFLISALGTAFPKTLLQFIIFRFIGGVGVGAASMTSPLYIAEMSPSKIRGRMVSVNQFAVIFGMLVVYFVNYFIAGQGDTAWNVQTGWRWMFGSEAIPAALLLILLFFVPESPRWLIKQKQNDRARGILARIGGTVHAQTELEDIERAIAQESSSLKQLFSRGIRYAVMIGILLAVFQQICGINVFLYYAPEIFKNLGTKTDVALLETIVVGIVMLTFTVVAIFTVDKLGRKPLLIIGYIGMTAALAAMGTTMYLGNMGAWVLLFLLTYIACFAMSAGPVVWVILSEIFPTRIRGRAMATATLFVWISNFIVSQTFPMMDENEWLVAKFNHAFPFWLYAIFCVCALLFTLRFVPETKGRTLEQIEASWLK